MTRTLDTAAWQFTPLTADLVDQLGTLPPALAGQCAACGRSYVPLVPTVTPVICADCLDRLAGQVVQPT